MTRAVAEVTELFVGPLWVLLCSFSLFSSNSFVLSCCRQNLPAKETDAGEY